MIHVNQLNSIFIRLIRYNLTVKIICYLKNKSSNINTVPVKILKSVCDVIIPCLTIIINRSLNSGVFSDNLEKDSMTPIPKVGDKCNFSNNRPISVLPVFSKSF